MTVSWAISMAYHKSENRNRMVLNGVGGWSVPPARTTKELQDIWPTYSAHVHLHMSNKDALHLDIFKQVFQQSNPLEQDQTDLCTNPHPMACKYISNP